MYRLVVSAALVASASYSNPAAADCAMVGLVAKVVSPPSSLPADGAILVVADPKVQGPLATGDVTVNQKWRLRTAKGLTAPAIEVLAPGLAAYRVPAGDVELEDDNHKVLGKAHVTTAKPSPLVAPKLKSLKFTGFTGRHTSQLVTAELDGSAPADAFAIVLADATGKARTFGLVEAGKPITPYHMFDCTPLPNGSVASKRGDKVTVFWVDTAGRKSAASAVITIR